MLFIVNAQSQSAVTKSSNIKFQSSIKPGLLLGQIHSKPSFTISTINGIQYKEWFTGIGAGIDYYGTKRSIPLFASVTRDFTVDKDTWFLYGNAGYNFPWLKDEEKMKNMDKYKATGGAFYELGAGFKFKVFNKTHFGFSAGYSLKQITEAYTYPCVWCEDYVPPSEKDTYTYRRIILKFNWWLL